MLTITRSTLARWEADGRITAVYSRRNTPGAGASVFRRADVEGLLGQANCKRRRKSVAGVRSHDARHPKERPHEHHVNDDRTGLTVREDEHWKDRVTKRFDKKIDAIYTIDDNLNESIQLDALAIEPVTDSATDARSRRVLAEGGE